MAEIVVDASVLSALFIKEKASEQIREIVEAEATLYAPSFWRFEVANAVWKTKTIPNERARKLMRIIWHYPVLSEEPAECADNAMAIARKHGAAFYDAFYIALAILKRVPLWTMDRVQAKVAADMGIALLRAGDY